MTTPTQLDCVRVASVAAIALAIACSEGQRREIEPTTSTSTTAMTSVGTSNGPTSITATDGTSGTSAADASGSGDTEKLDVNEVVMGCQYVDLLFVIDNSESMQTYQQALADQFPAFAQAMFDTLPDGIDVHVAITTSDFDFACDAAESTSNCQTTATVQEVMSHYVTPDNENNGGNGSQGRLFNWSGQRWFETTTDADVGELSTWFSGAATAAGEDGCSFEMPVAAAGWATHPANAATNEGFLRDAGGLFVIFFLTDEPDKSPESKTVYESMILDAKSECGGADCVFVSGLIPACTLDVNQKLWQFLQLFGDTEPPWGDIVDTANYHVLVGDALATAVAEACADVPIP